LKTVVRDICHTSSTLIHKSQQQCFEYSLKLLQTILFMPQLSHIVN